MKSDADNTLNILVIDDQKHDRDIIKRCLMQQGKHINVHEIDNAKAAIDILKNKEKDFDCVFLDYMMPGADGIEILNEVIGGETDMLAMPVIMLTGHSDENVVIRAIQGGALDYLSKDNLTPTTLRIAITKAIKIHQLKQLHKKTQQQLLQTQKLEAIGQLTGGVAHDFNNLLTIILGNTRLIRKMPALHGTETEKRVLMIEDTAKRGAELVRRLMVFTRQRPVTEAIVDVNGIIDQLEKLLEHTLDKTIEIRANISEVPLPVCIDGGQFENILVNMAINARDAMPQGGVLSIEADSVVLDEDYCRQNPTLKPGPYVMVVIADTGTGMPRAVIEKAFEPFFTTKEVGKGTGLGLSMAYGCVRDAGGDIHIYSEEEKGTVFRIYLPQAKPHAVGEKKAASADQWHGRKETILVVDNDDNLREMASILLDRMGYVAVSVSSGREALNLLNENQVHVDLVLTDMFMDDDMNGLDLADRVRAEWPEIGILLMTGFTESMLAKYELIKNYEVIGKPLFRDQLGPLLRKMLDEDVYKPEEHGYGV